MFRPFVKGVGFAASPQGRKLIFAAVALAQTDEGRKLVQHARRVAASPESRKLATDTVKVAGNLGKSVAGPENRARVRAAARLIADRYR
jgi:hypothetical protein